MSCVVTRLLTGWYVFFTSGSR